MSTTFTYDAYLSHSFTDKPRVLALAEQLRDAGLRIWIDDWIVKPGDDIYLEMQNGLEASRTLVLCMSKAAFDSPWRQRETALFRDPTNTRRRFIPLLLEDCAIPDSLSMYRWVDWRAESQIAFDNLVVACQGERKKTQSFEYDVFLSHSSADKPRVREFAEKLRDVKLRVWLDEWIIQPGDSIPLANEQGLESSRTLVLFVSEAAFSNEWVTLERHTALFRDPTNKHRRIVLVQLDDCKIPNSLNSVVASVDWKTDPISGFDRLHSICSAPPEIYSQGLQAVEEWWQALTAEDRPLNELKVVLVGNGGAGKTSVRKRLMDDSFDAKESQTHGIAIDDWDIDCEDEEVLVHFWDFGGQEIMHATHQFFLSHRSLYILVLDGRKEEDAEYWLKHIESFGGDSPVLVVLNKIDENPGFELNRQLLKDKYNGIVDFFRVSCLSQSGINELRQALQATLLKVGMANSRWPAKWFRIKRRLESNTADFIAYEDYKTICATEDLHGSDGQELLVRFLHDLGVVLHFEDLNLFNTQVLNPRWVTQAVYRLINAKALADGQGILDVRQLTDILRPNTKDDFTYPGDKHGYIINLMMKFELCYELAHQQILVPDLLPVNEPDYEFANLDALQFVIAYDFLPRSVMPRFIVKKHNEIMDDLRWRSGVVLENEVLKSSAVIKADGRDRKVTISVAGEQRREFFARIRGTLDEIHQSFEKVTFKELVPLPGYPGHTVEYEELIGHEIMGQQMITVGQLRKQFPVKQLLNGIEPESERIARQQQETIGMTKIEVTIGDGAVFHGDFAVGQKSRAASTKRRKQPSRMSKGTC